MGTEASQPQDEVSFRHAATTTTTTATTNANEEEDTDFDSSDDEAILRQATLPTTPSMATIPSVTASTPRTRTPHMATHSHLSSSSSSSSSEDVLMANDSSDNVATILPQNSTKTTSCRHIPLHSSAESTNPLPPSPDAQEAATALVHTNNNNNSSSVETHVLGGAVEEKKDDGTSKASQLDTELQEAPVSSSSSSPLLPYTSKLSSVVLQDRDLPSQLALSQQCWKCTCPLAASPSSGDNGTVQEEEEEEGEGRIISLYAIHHHPFMSEVPVCSVCSDELEESLLLAQTSRGIPDASSSAAVALLSNAYYYPNKCDLDDICLACGKDGIDDDSDDDDTATAAAAASPTTTFQLLLCDTCDRACCVDCVAKAHGSYAMPEILKNDPGPWKCLSCDPPVRIQSLISTALASSIGRCSSTTKTNTNTDGDSHHHHRSLEEAIQELHVLEEQLQSSDDLLNSDRVRPQEEGFRKEIRDELLQEYPHLALDELEQRVADEWQALQVYHRQHMTRIQETIAELHDELTFVHGVDVLETYKIYFGFQVDSTDGDGSSSTKPQWALEADRALQQQEKEREEIQGTAITSVYPEEVYQEEIYQDVEDIGDIINDDENGKQQLHIPKCWRAQQRPSQQQIERYDREEREHLQQSHVVVTRSTDDAQDMESTVEEYRVCSTGSGDGVRVRRKTPIAPAFKTAEQRREKFTVMAQQAHQSSMSMKSSIIGASSEIQRSGKKRVSAMLISAASGGETKPPSFGPPLGNNKASKPSHSTRLSTLNGNPGDSKTQLPNIANLPGTVDSVSEGRARSSAEFKSNLALCTSGLNGAIRTLGVSRSIAKHLKQHQRDGAKFIWDMVLGDLAKHREGDRSLTNGCIVAHNMGLGKSLTTIAVLHTAMNHPSLVHPHTNRRLIRRVLLVVPVNTITNWENELHKWTAETTNPLTVMELGVGKSARIRSLQRWRLQGGILPMSMQTYVSMCNEMVLDHKSVTSEFDADILVIDEAHLSLKSKGSMALYHLKDIATPRRILLTGTPFQNNLLEFYRLVTFASPTAFGDTTEKQFKREFQDPIVRGQASDAPAEVIFLHKRKTNELKKMLLPFIHRRDASVLREVLPPMQQAVLHVMPTKLQRDLVRDYRKHQDQMQLDGDSYAKNFFREMKELAPVHNHPACLLEKQTAHKWWDRLLTKCGSNFSKVQNGGKVVLLLHILAFADQLGEKVLVFSQCLKTLNFVEKVLQIPDWIDHVPSLQAFASNRERLGGWKKNVEYVRIDGGKSSGERGDLIDQFNDHSQDTTRVFLLSSVAGGVGINLQTANRVVLLDGHFNPSVTDQCIFRAYRYGQKKDVFCYRLLEKGTLEERIYAKAVTKTGMQKQLLDGEAFTRMFTEAELSASKNELTWVQCDSCEKWRGLIGIDNDMEELPEQWFCKMNTDPLHQSCAVPEKSPLWYEKYLRHLEDGETATTCTDVAEDIADPKLQDSAAKQHLVQNDAILKHLLTLNQSKGKERKLIRDFFFHDVLLSGIEDHDKRVDKPPILPTTNDGSGSRKPVALVPVPTKTKMSHEAAKETPRLSAPPSEALVPSSSVQSEGAQRSEYPTEHLAQSTSKVAIKGDRTRNRLKEPRSEPRGDSTTKNPTSAIVSSKGKQTRAFSSIRGSSSLKLTTGEDSDSDDTFGDYEDIKTEKKENNPARDDAAVVNTASKTSSPYRPAISSAAKTTDVGSKAPQKTKESRQRPVFDNSSTSISGSDGNFIPANKDSVFDGSLGGEPSTDPSNDKSKTSSNAGDQWRSIPKVSKKRKHPPETGKYSPKRKHSNRKKKAETIIDLCDSD